MKFFVAAFLLFVTASAGAQLSYGPKLGLNLSQVTLSSPAFDGGFRPGFFAGAFANYALGDKFSVQAEALYSSEGGNEKNTVTGDKGHINFSYLQVPLLARYKFTPNFFAEAGPQLGFLLSAKDKYDGEDLDIKQYYKSTDFRFPVGIGYQFDASQMHALTINLRYAFSLSPVNEANVNGDDLKVQVFSVGAAIRF